MEKVIIETIKKLVKDSQPLTSEKGANLANLGPILSSQGVNFKNLGFTKLRELFEDPDLQPFFILEKDDSSYPPIYYVKLTEEKSLKSHNKNLTDTLTTTKRTDERFPKTKDNSYRNSKEYNIMKWAYFPDDYPKAIQSLKDMALKEKWYYERQKPDYPYPILSNYLRFTYVRLEYEKKIKYSNNYAAFNTGLVNALYDPIYALFGKNKNEGMQPWYFLNFCVAGQNKEGKILSTHFNPLPEKAVYFQTTGDYIYDGKGTPQMDWEHIILENVRRLPLDFLLEHKPADFTFKDTCMMNETQKNQYYQELAEAIKADQRTYRSIKNRIEDALNISIKRANWNYKTAIPMYYPTRNTTSLLLPLSLLDEKIIDVALVIEKTPSGNYIGQTILPLEWAYSNARLITRPDSDWLVTELIREDDNFSDE